MIKLGKIVNTHGIKGEVRVISNFSNKKEVFKKNMNFYINDKAYKVSSYRVHKNYDMVTFEGIKDINEVLCLKGLDVYVKRADIKIDGYLKEDLIGFEVYEEKIVGIVTNIIDGKQVLLEINNKHLIPFVDEFIKNVDVSNKKIEVTLIEGLINEN